MGTVKRLVCLANSYMTAGRCVAGIEVTAEGQRGVWVRAVGDHAAGGLRREQCLYEDGTEPRVLDIMEVPLQRPSPKGHHTENWLIDFGKRWRYVGRMEASNLAQFVDPEAPLWASEYHSKRGVNDRVPQELALRQQASLRLVYVEKMHVLVKTYDGQGNRPKRCLRASFRYAGEQYALRVTDRAFEQSFKGKPDGGYPLGGRFLTISLAQPYTDDFCYKLVAAVIEP